MKRTSTLKLLSYWDGLRQGRGALERLEAARPEVKKMLAGTFLIEADPERAYPLKVLGVRLAGLAPNARLGASFLECWDERGRSDLEALLPAVHDEEHPLVLGALSHAAGAGPLRVEVLLLPLASGSDGKSRVLGGMAAKMTGRASAPNRLELMSARTVDMRDWRVRAAPTGPATPNARALRAGLRVIEGGRSCAQV